MYRFTLTNKRIGVLFAFIRRKRRSFFSSLIEMKKERNFHYWQIIDSMHCGKRERFYSFFWKKLKRKTKFFLNFLIEIFVTLTITLPHTHTLNSKHTTNSSKFSNFCEMHRVLVILNFFFVFLSFRPALGCCLSRSPIHSLQTEQAKKWRTKKK